MVVLVYLGDGVSISWWNNAVHDVFGEKGDTPYFVQLVCLLASPFAIVISLVSTSHICWKEFANV